MIGTVVVTGGLGFIGSHLVRLLLSGGHASEVINIDCLTYAGNEQNLADVAVDPRYRLLRASIESEAAMEAALRRSDVVIHCAAESHVDRAIDGPMAFARTNALGTASILDAARRVGVRRFVHVGTDEAYGSLEPGDPPWTEAAPLRPRNPYSASKAAADHLVLSYHATYGMDVVITRGSNTYGPMQCPEKFIAIAVMALLDGRPIPIHGSGTNMRDWLHVSDHCAGIVAAMEHGLPGAAYNLGGNCERSNLAMAWAICRLMGTSEPRIEFVDDRPGNDQRYAMNSSKAEREIGWRPRVALEDGLRGAIAWYRENRAKWSWTPYVRRVDAERRLLVEVV